MVKIVWTDQAIQDLNDILTVHHSARQLKIQRISRKKK